MYFEYFQVYDEAYAGGSLSILMDKLSEVPMEGK